MRIFRVISAGDTILPSTLAPFHFRFMMQAKVVEIYEAMTYSRAM
jgi:hypothetical protein